MTDLSHEPLVRPALVRARRTAWKPWPLLPYVCVFAAAGAGLLAGRALGGDADAFEPKLLLLLRFMAAMKFCGVLLAAGATQWRLTHPIEGRLAAGYVATLVVMAAAPGLIWSLGGIALGALLFHAGLLAFLVLAWKDDGARLPLRR